MKRVDAVELLHKYVKSENMIKHCLASEAVLTALADRLGADREKWALAGLLHDLDVELTTADLQLHGLKTVEILESRGIDAEILDAIRMHNEEAAGDRRTEVFHHALAENKNFQKFFE